MIRVPRALDNVGKTGQIYKFEICVYSSLNHCIGNKAKSLNFQSQERRISKLERDIEGIIEIVKMNKPATIYTLKKEWARPDSNRGPLPRQGNVITS